MCDRYMRRTAWAVRGAERSRRAPLSSGAMIGLTIARQVYSLCWMPDILHPGAMRLRWAWHSVVLRNAME